MQVVDLFCGCGGWSRGLRDAGHSIVAAFDNDRAAADCHILNFPEAHTWQVDLAEMSPVEVWGKLTKYADITDSENLIIAGSPPCQYWSTMQHSHRTTGIGRRTESRLTFKFAEIIDYIRPAFVMMENVPGAANTESGVAELMQRLDAAGYIARAWKINMKYHGVPQSRERFIILASRFSFPEMPAATSPRTVRDTIGEHNGFPRLEMSYRHTDKMNRSEGGKAARAALAETPQDGGSHPTLAAQHKRASYSRLWWDRPAPTVTCAFGKTGNGRNGHPSENRPLTLREGAALQTFPTDFKFLDNRGVRINARLIGNAVPPEFARRVGALIPLENPQKSL